MIGDTVVNIIDKFGLVYGIVVLLLIFVAMAYVAMYRYIISKETKFTDYVEAKDLESINVNKAHSAENSEIHKAHAKEVARLNTVHTDKITEILDKHDAYTEKMQDRYINENRQMSTQFVAALRETTEALHNIRDFNELRFNAMEKDLGEIKQKVNKS